MYILHNHVFLYIVHTIDKNKSLVLHIFKSHDFKTITLFPKKTRHFKKHELFNKSNKPSLCILHYHTLF